MMTIDNLRTMGFRSVHVPLTRGQWAIVDIEDAPRILQHRWSAKKNARSRTFYAVRHNTGVPDEERKSILMHREILGLPVGRQPEVDHFDWDGLNNRKSNFRVCKRRQNGANRALNGNNTSGFKGVGYTARGNKHWVAFIRVNWKRITLGYFATPEAAAAAYDTAAKKYFGEFAATNESLAA